VGCGFDWRGLMNKHDDKQTLDRLWAVGLIGGGLILWIELWCKWWTMKSFETIAFGTRCHVCHRADA
jgi:hypothetical protein